MYHIRPYQRLISRNLKVIIRPSSTRNYKLDIFDQDDKYITSIGDKRYGDYLTFVEENGYDFANRRRELYLKRHKKDSKVEGTRGWYVSKLLWAG